MVPAEKVSGVNESREARDLERRRIAIFISLVRGLLTRVTIKECGLGAMGGVPR